MDFTQTHVSIILLHFESYTLLVILRVWWFYHNQDLLQTKHRTVLNQANTKTMGSKPPRCEVFVVGYQPTTVAEVLYRII
jgi:hypothetical protein